MSLVGTRVGPYTLCACIASGGFGSVHLARRGGALGFSRIFAAKVLREARAGEIEATSMFIDEARISSRINHPNVVPVLDVVEADERFWLIMDYVPGQSLGGLLGSPAGRVPPPIALAIACGVLRGLDAAHEATDGQGRPLSIVHRDVSPHNVIISVHGEVKVVDFGIAKAIGRLSVTHAGQVKGKLAYMAPEQQNAAVVDRRADLYALAVMAWELLVGERMPAYRDPQRLAERLPDAPVELRAIVAKNLAPAPADRHATAAEMADAIERCGRLASEREVAAWLVSWAADALRERAELLASIERDTVVTGPPDAARGAPDATESALVVGLAGGSQRAEGSAPPPVAPTPTAPRAAPARGWLAAGFLAGVTAALVLVAGSMVVGSEPRGVVHGGVSSVQVTAVGVSAVAPAALTAARDPMAPSATPVASSAPAAIAAPAASTRAGLPTARSTIAASAAPPPPVDCDPPYVIDARGVKVLRPECMH